MFTVIVTKWTSSDPSIWWPNNDEMKKIMNGMIQIDSKYRNDSLMLDYMSKVDAFVKLCNRVSPRYYRIQDGTIVFTFTAIENKNMAVWNNQVLKSTEFRQYSDSRQRLLDFLGVTKEVSIDYTDDIKTYDFVKFIL